MSVDAKLATTGGPAQAKRPGRILLFDVDGTLTLPRLKMTNQMVEFFKEVRKDNYIAIVGGSDLAKQKEQIGEHVLNEWDYVFSENGLQAFKEGSLLEEQSLLKFYGNDKLKPFINFVLRYVADLDIPVKRGTFVEWRNGMINVSPIGRNCSQAEREEFDRYDKVHKIRETMVKVLEKEFAHLNLKFSIGGQISFDVFPQGWDKTFCLQFLQKDGFKEIHFFGDKTEKGGNDYEIYSDSRVIGHSVKNPDDTKKIVSEILGKS